MKQIHYLKQIRGFYFFPIIIFVVFIILLKERTILYLFLFLIVFFRMICFKNKKILYVSVALIVFGLAMWWVKFKHPPEIIQENQLVTIELIPDTIKVDGAVLTFEGKMGERKQPGVITYILKSEEEKHFIEQNKKSLRLTAKLEPIENLGVRNLNGFDYGKYLENKGNYQRYNLVDIMDLKVNKLSMFDVVTKIKEWRRGCFIHTNQHFKERTRSYLNSLLFGFQNKGDSDYQQTWRDLGVAHLFSLSGMHIYFFLFLFDFVLLSCHLTKENLFKWNILFTLFVMIMTGMGPGMMRAGVLHVVKQFNRKWQFQLSLLDCWSIALFINCLVDPYVLLTVGGQLTYYLTFLIVIIGPIIQKIKQPVLKMVVFNLVLSVMSLPLIWYHFYEWNYLSFVINLVLGSFILSILMPMLLLVFILSFIFTNYQFPLIESCLKYFQILGNNLNEISFSHQVIGKIPLSLIIVLILSQLFLLKEFEKNQFKLNAKIILLCSVTAIMPFYKYLNPNGMLAFVDIGQGDAIFVQLPHHQGNYLLDTGGRLDFKVDDWQKRADKRGADYTLIPFLKSRGVKTLDAVFISHAHEDHFGDLDRVSETFYVRNLFFGPGTAEQPNFRKMLNYSTLEKTNKRVVDSNNEWTKGNIELTCLFPKEKGDGQNNDSLVMMLEIKSKKILLTGDLEKEGEEKLLKDPMIDLEADILKAGHHGSKTSTHPAFLSQVNPEIVIISCGLNNRYQHPSKETVALLEEYEIPFYQTDQQGMLYMTWNSYNKNLSRINRMK